MYKGVRVLDGVEVSIEVTDEMMVNYSVGSKKVSFNIEESELIDGIEENYAHEGIAETVLWSAVYKGECRMERNNDQAESRRHISYSSYKNGGKFLASEEDLEDEVIRALEVKRVIKSIRCLSQEQQALIGNIFFRGVARSDIARADGVSNAAVSYRVERALKSLGRFVKNH